MSDSPESRGGEFSRRLWRMVTEAAANPPQCEGCDLDGPPGVHFPPDDLVVFGDGTGMATGDAAQLHAAAAWLERHRGGA